MIFYYFHKWGQPQHELLFFSNWHLGASFIWSFLFWFLTCWNQQLGCKIRKPNAAYCIASCFYVLEEASSKTKHRRTRSCFQMRSPWWLAWLCFCKPIFQMNDVYFCNFVSSISNIEAYDIWIFCRFQSLTLTWNRFFNPSHWFLQGDSTAWLLVIINLSESHSFTDLNEDCANKSSQVPKDSSLSDMFSQFVEFPAWQRFDICRTFLGLEGSYCFIPSCCLCHIRAAEPLVFYICF